MERSSVPVCLSKYSVRTVLFLLSIITILCSVSVSAAQIWEDFTVWYDGNGADSGKITKEKYKSGTNEITLKKNEASKDKKDTPFTRKGCTFLGWSLIPEGESAITPILAGGTEWEPMDVPTTWSEEKNGFVFYARWDCGTGSVSQQAPAPTATLLIAPPEETASPVLTQESTSEPPMLLLAPSGRSSGKDAENQADGLLQSKGLYSPDYSGPALLPLKFFSDISNMVPLPATGITTAAGFSRLQKPASVKYEPVAMELQIPSLGVTSEIVYVEFGDNSYPLEWLGMDTGLLEGTSLPGEGFSVLAAHNTLDAETAGPFALISTMNVGDHIFIRKHNNRLLIFEIYANEKINEFDYETLYKTGFQYDGTVALLTCEDERAEGGYASRRIVVAKLIP